MTVTTTIPSIRYIYTGVGQYDFPFRAFKEDDIQVWHTTQQGVQYHLNLNIDYEVEVYDGIEGGYVTVLPAAPIPTEGYLLIRRILPIDQEIDWVNNDPFDMELHEASQDKLTMILQQQQVIVEEGSIALRWRGPWLPDTIYLLGQMVSVADRGNNIYACAEEHVSAPDFDTDLNAGRWILVFDMEYLTSLIERAEQAAADAEAAQAAAEAAQAAAELARDAAQAAQAAAELAQAAAEAAQAAAETAQAGSETARDESLNWSVVSSQWAEYTVDEEIPGYPGRYSSRHWATYSEYWAENPEDVEIPNHPGQFSSLHWAAKAEGWAAGLNLPPILPGDALKVLQVTADETGYQHTDVAAVGDLKSDGSVPMDGAFTPTLPRHLIFKEYADNLIGAIQAGENIDIDTTDPLSPIISVPKDAFHPYAQVLDTQTGAVAIDVSEFPVTHIDVAGAINIDLDPGAAISRAATCTLRIINPGNNTVTFDDTISWPNNDPPAVGDWEGTWEVGFYTLDGGTTWIASNRVEY